MRFVTRCSTSRRPSTQNWEGDSTNRRIRRLWPSRKNEMSSPSQSVTLHHNLDPRRFVFLWMKYVRGVNLEHHCTNCLRGPYGKKLSKHNAELASSPRLLLDECLPGSYEALYICGVARQGYRQKQNYPHNLHTAVLPAPGENDVLEFENWKLSIENGRFIKIPGADALPSCLRKLPPEYTTCRIFRFAALYDELVQKHLPASIGLGGG